MAINKKSQVFAFWTIHKPDVIESLFCFVLYCFIYLFLHQLHVTPIRIRRFVINVIGCPKVSLVLKFFQVILLTNAVALNSV